MNQGNALAVAAGAIMALVLITSALRDQRLSFKTKAAMALAWLFLIVGASVVATWWRP